MIAPRALGSVPEPNPSRYLKGFGVIFGTRIRSLLHTNFVPAAKRNVLPANTLLPLPLELTATGSRRDMSLSLPVGFEKDRILEMLRTISIENAPTSELEGYLSQDFERFLITLGLVRGLSGRALEIGANPYFTSVLLKEFTDLELTMTNSFDPRASGVHSQLVRYVGKSGVAVAEQFEYESLNVETMRFPYLDDAFDVVVFCEVIEHLLMDPVAALNEIGRVLKHGGTLITSTPNVARLENVARLAAGANIYDPYSGYGPYGRHNREFTRHELVKRLEFSGFELEDHFTADVHPHQSEGFVDVTKLAPILEGRLPDLGQYLFARARNLGPPENGRPAELFRSLSAEKLLES